MKTIKLIYVSLLTIFIIGTSTSCNPTPDFGESLDELVDVSIKHGMLQYKATLMDYMVENEVGLGIDLVEVDRLYNESLSKR